MRETTYPIVFHFVYYGMWIWFDHDCSCCSLSQVLVLPAWLVTPCLVTVCLVTRSTQLQEWNLTEKVCICSPFVCKLTTTLVGEMRHFPPKVIGCLFLVFIVVLTLWREIKYSSPKKLRRLDDFSRHISGSRKSSEVFGGFGWNNGNIRVVFGKCTENARKFSVNCRNLIGVVRIMNKDCYMALSHKDRELLNSWIWLAEIDFDSGLDFPI